MTRREPRKILSAEPYVNGSGLEERSSATVKTVPKIRLFQKIRKMPEFATKGVYSEPAEGNHVCVEEAAPRFTSFTRGNISWSEMLVRKKGLEPLRPFGHQLLRLARLPIPPLPHSVPSIASRRVQP